MTPSQKALILANGASSRRKPCKVMRKRAELLGAKELAKQIGGHRKQTKILDQRLRAL